MLVSEDVVVTGFVLSVENISTIKEAECFDTEKKVKQ